MPRKYSQEDLELAVRAVNDGMSLGEAAKQFNVPKPTLFRYKKNERNTLVKAGRRQSIPPETEQQCVDAIIRSAKSGFPLTKSQVLIRFGRLCHELELDTQFKNGYPGDKFWRGLKQRHQNLSIRSPECCSHNRLKALTQERVDKYFNDLHTLIEKEGIQPEAIWNMDETGLQFQHKPPKVRKICYTHLLYKAELGPTWTAKGFLSTPPMTTIFGRFV